MLTLCSAHLVEVKGCPRAPLLRHAARDVHYASVLRLTNNLCTT